MKDKNLCIIARCSNKRLSRGLCSNHYWHIAQAIRKGETTWGEEEKLGMALAPITGKECKRRKEAVIPTDSLRSAVEKTTQAAHSHGKTCIRPGCQSKATTKGLCPADYAYAYRLVRSKQTSWEKLEKAGKVLSNANRGPKGKSEVREYFLGKSK